MAYFNYETVKRSYRELIKGNTIIIKLKASENTGLGHLSRMLTLANMLKDKRIIFAINDFEYAKKKIADEGFEIEVNSFHSDEEFIDFLLDKYFADCIIVDEKYCYKSEDIERWQKKTKFISIDLICEGYEVCEKIIMPNAHFQPEKYQSFNNIAWGWEWVLINKDVLKLKPKESISKEIKSIVISTGGSDPKGVLFKILDCIKNTDKKVYVLIGDSFKHKEKLQELNLPDNFKIYPYNPSYLLKGDVGIATFGVTVYEFIYFNIPVYCVGHTRENAKDCEVLSKRCKMVKSLGWVADVDCGRKKGFKNEVFS